MPESTLLESATRRNHGRDPYSRHADCFGHRVRGSDASTYDEICITCGATDRAWDNALLEPCTQPLPNRE